MHIKIMEARRDKMYSYTNINLNSLETNAAILFNKMHRTKQLTPRYIRKCMHLFYK